MAGSVETLGAMKSAKAAFMERMSAFIDARADAALKAMHRARHFEARSEGQKRRRQRERAERTAPNYKLIERTQ